MPTTLSPPLTPLIDTVTGSVTEIGRIYLRTLAAAVGALAPLTAPYWVSTSDPTLPAEQNLGALAAGYLKIAVAVGIATPSTVPTIPQADITGLTAALVALTAAIAAKATLPITEADVTSLVADLAAKRALIPRVTSVASSATPTPNADTTDLYDLTAQAAAAAFAAPTGTPHNAQRLTIRIKDNGTARALTWDAVYVAGGVAIPSTTVLSKILTLEWIYNTANALNAWQLVAAAQEV
jgi:hypothetical protein